MSVEHLIFFSFIFPWKWFFACSLLIVDKKLKSYENPNTINGILKGEITEYKDIISCDCSLGNLRDITVQLNYIILGYIITFFIVNKIFDFFN